MWFLLEIKEEKSCPLFEILTWAALSFDMKYFTQYS